jgi:FHA domain
MKLRVSHASGALIFEKDFSFTSLTVGRGDKALCRIDDVRISKLHLALKQEGQWFLVKDLDSQNGTKFENIPLTEKRLQPPFCLLLSDSVKIEVSLSNTVVHTLPMAIQQER